MKVITTDLAKHLMENNLFYLEMIEIASRGDKEIHAQVLAYIERTKKKIEKIETEYSQEIA